MLKIAEWIARLLRPDPDFERVGQLFLRLLALIYLAAFVSAALEIVGLVGSEGILPVGEYLGAVKGAFGASAVLHYPTLFWIDHRDAFLLGSCYLGGLFALLLLFGRWPAWSAAALFVLYLSVFRVGQTFFNFQWDYLLLEAGFLSIFLAAGGPSRLLVFLFHWLLFRLRFLSGLAKILSDDPAWANLTTLKTYFETQPLPHIGAWYAHQFPDVLLKTGTGFVLFVELVVPFFIFLPRPFRITAAMLTILVQLAIIATSNHNFINLLTIALCLFLLDDKFIARVLPRRRMPTTAVPAGGRLSRLILAPVGVVLLAASSISAIQMITDRRDEIPGADFARTVRSWGLANAYHVFPNMQTERQELIIEGSDDGTRWIPYRFRYKPNDPSDMPGFIVPLHPRLDWMMWFIPPQNPMMRPWFERFLWRLHQNSPSVTALLEYNPFPSKGPRYLRVQAYRYRFSSPVERERSGHIWQSEYLGEFPRVPPRQP